MKIRVVLIAGFLLVANLTALHASVIFNFGNNPQSDEENILFGSAQSGSLVTGLTNISNTSVSFSSTADVLKVTAHGQANLDAADHMINNLTIALTGGGTYQDLIINPYVDSCFGYWPATVTVTASDGTFSYTYRGGLDHGQNYLTIVASPGETISSTTISAPNGFDELRQTRISGIVPAGQVPEPGSMLLLAGGLLILGSRRLRRL
jgi:hypothetical protein